MGMQEVTPLIRNPIRAKGSLVIVKWCRCRLKPVGCKEQLH